MLKIDIPALRIVPMSGEVEENVRNCLGLVQADMRIIFVFEQFSILKITVFPWVQS